MERVPAPLKLDDISRNGRVLVTKGLNLGGITCLIPGETREREVGWLDFARVEGLGGRQDVLFGAFEGIGEVAHTQERRTDHPRSDWATATPSRCRRTASGCWREPERDGVGARMVLVPTGPGAPRLLPRGAITQLVTVPGCPMESGSCSPRSRKATRRAATSGCRNGADAADHACGCSHARKAATPDGKSVLVWLDGKWFLYPIDGGQPRPISLIGTDDSPRGGALTDVSSTSRGGGVPPVAIERLDVTTGRREPWKTLVPSDPVGIERLDPPVITPDGRGYCYCARRHHELYVVDGLK